MAEQEAGRSELPTPFKLEDARKKGIVVHSADVSSLGVLLGFMLAVLSAGSGIVQVMLQIGQFSWGIGLSANPMDVLHMILPLVWHEAGIPLLVLAVCALLSVWIQHKPVFSVQPLKPDWKKINPAEGAKRFFSLKSLLLLLLVVSKVLILSVVCYGLFRHFVADVLMATGHPTAVWALLRRLAWASALLLILAFSLFALIDYLINQRMFIRQMKMSPREIRDENKRREGDPLIKRRIRQYRLELLKKTKALAAVPQANFVIVNPTHYAVAIQYNPRIIDAPIVIAKGGGTMARRIRQIAARHGVPVFARRSLTRTLFFSVALGKPVGAEHYRHIALLMKQARLQRRKQ